MYDLTIAYRIYPKISKVPAIYPNDKYKMSEICLKSFVKSLGNLNVKIYVIFDGCGDEYRELFSKEFANFEYEFINVDSIGNGKTFKLQLDLLYKADSDFVYFAEDDYFYLDNSIKELLDFAKNNNVDFTTAYDHLDHYNHKLHKNSYPEIIEYKSKKYTKRLTTTMTFLAKKESLIESYDIFETYSRNNWDNSMWLAITSNKLINPFEFIRLSCRDLQMLKMYIKAFIYTSKYLLGRKKYSLWIPNLGTATHLDNKFLSPDVDWYNEFKKFIK